MVNRAKKTMDNHPTLSTRKLAKRLCCSQAITIKMLNQGPNPVKCYNRMKIPKCPVNEKAQRKAAGELYRRLLNLAQPKKEENPTNVPQARPIEICWATLKRVCLPMVQRLLIWTL